MKRLGAIMLLCSILASCKKYEGDDRFFHLRSAKRRLIKHNWIVSNTQNFNTGKNVILGQNPISFSKSGNFSGSVYPNNGSDGTWEFMDHKNKLKITSSNGVITEYEITRLDNYTNPETSMLEFKDDSLIHSYRSHDKIK